MFGWGNIDEIFIVIYIFGLFQWIEVVDVVCGYVGVKIVIDFCC